MPARWFWRKLFKATNLIQTKDAALEFGRDDYLLQKDVKKFEQKVIIFVSESLKATNAMETPRFS